jgi:hypothetical protein
VGFLFPSRHQHVSSFFTDSFFYNINVSVIVQYSGTAEMEQNGPIQYVVNGKTIIRDLNREKLSGQIVLRD